MATDTNAFDAYLKDRLHRDILFRIGIWSAIAASAGAYATRKAQFSGFDYFEKAADLLLPLLNLFGSISVFLVLIALFFKDVEHVHPDGYGQGTKIGKVGGVFRRLAGDLSLWVIGTLISLLTALSIAVVLATRNSTVTPKDWAAITWMYLVFFGFLFVMSVLNVYARRAQPPLADAAPFRGFMTSPTRVLLLYGACALFVVWYAGYFGGG